MILAELYETNAFKDNKFQDKFTKIILCGWIIGKVFFFFLVVKSMNRI
jgi:hypothetical protein